MNEASSYYIKEKELVDGIITQQTKAFESLYLKNQASISNMILANSGKHEDAEDVLQEAVLILFKNFSKPDFELRSTVSTYLFSISRKIWLRKLKSNSKKRVTSLDKLQLSTKDDFDEKELEISRKRLYRKTFEKLDKDCREVLRLFFNKHSMQEIAQQLNYGSISYAKKKKFMCKKKLIALIKSDPFYKELST